MVSSNIKANSSQLDAALAAIDTKFRKHIVETYVDLRAALAEGNFDAAGLRVGRFAESALRFLQQELTGQHIPFNRRINNFAAECRKLEQLPQTAGQETLRVIMPRALLIAYTLRNKRGIGHVGGDVNANEIDAATCVRLADWCLCELIRVFHTLSLEEAQAILDAISVRQLPAIWAVAGKRRVLDTSLNYKSQVLLLLHAEPEPGTLVEDLFDWVEHSRMDNFKAQVLRRLHDDRLIEWDRETGSATISPSGAKKVEEEILPKIKAAGGA